MYYELGDMRDWMKPFLFSLTEKNGHGKTVCPSDDTTVTF